MVVSRTPLVVSFYVGRSACSGKPAYRNSKVAVSAGGKRGKTLSCAAPGSDGYSQEAFFKPSRARRAGGRGAASAARVCEGGRAPEWARVRLSAVPVRFRCRHEQLS